MVEIPSSYIVSKFNQYCGKTSRTSRYLNGCCPICREGKSWGKKKRLYYFFKENYFYCQNCQASHTPYFWIKEVTGMSWKEIKTDVEEYTGDPIEFVEFGNQDENTFIPVIPPLPSECVNVTDINQLKFYMDNWVVRKGLDYIKNRRLDTARFSPKTYYICLNDKYHKNRLVIPYYDEYGRVKNYISRTFLDKDQRTKYMLKFNSPKDVFNLDLIDNEYPYLFPIEGPIDSMFLKNSVAISGTTMTEKQDNDISQIHPFHKKIWIFDNQRTEGDVVRNKIAEKIREGETVFMWEGPFEPYKDLNQYCVEKRLDFVDPALIQKFSYEGDKALLRL